MRWLTHSIQPVHIADFDFRIRIGGPDCKQPYSASIYNISAMSFGALSANAIQALNNGARIGGFAHDTGEGGISRYHRSGGGDLIYEIGSGYFGCRNPDGTFSEDTLRRTGRRSADQADRVEAEPGRQARAWRHAARRQDHPQRSPRRAACRWGRIASRRPRHGAFSTPLEMMQFIGRLRDLSGGKPVGFKLCIGHRREFMCIVKAMLETGIVPDFIVVDGKEGGTGAAPLEFANHVGMPLVEGLTFVHNTLRGAGIARSGQDRRGGQAGDGVRHRARALALGADWANSARGFMFAIGCIQAQACHTNHCPVGVATQDKLRQRALVVPEQGANAWRGFTPTR